MSIIRARAPSNSKKMRVILEIYPPDFIGIIYTKMTD